LLPRAHKTAWHADPALGGFRAALTISIHFILKAEIMNPKANIFRNSSNSERIVIGVIERVRGRIGNIFVDAHRNASPLGCSHQTDNSSERGASKTTFVNRSRYVY
jgi:hypothetical protein